MIRHLPPAVLASLLMSEPVLSPLHAPLPRRLKHHPSPAERKVIAARRAKSKAAKQARKKNARRGR